MNTLRALITRRIAHRPDFSRIVENIGWLFFDRVLRVTVGLLVSVWLARYLGPKQFGQLNYTIAFVSVFGAIAALGLNGIVVRDVVRKPASSDTTLGTAFALQITAAILTIGLLLATIAGLRPADDLTKAMVAILGLSLLFKSSDIVKYWFEAQVQSRYTVWVENSVFLLISAVKIALILWQAPLIAFVWILLAEAVLVAVGLFSVYLMREKSLRRWSADPARARLLLKDSWPMVLMTLMLVVYTKIDIFMVEYFLGWNATGVYSAALTVAESWYFIAVIMTASVYPALIRARATSTAVFNRNLAAFYSLMFWLPVLASVLVFLVSQDLMLLLYGEKFPGVSRVFSIYIWSSIFVFVITASSRWFLVNNFTKSLMYRASVGACSNIILNYYLIPIFGLPGAAIATLISYFFVAYVYDIFDRNARGQLRLKMSAPVLPFLWLANELRTKNG